MNSFKVGQNKPYVMYADDDPDDLLFVEEALKKVAPAAWMRGFKNGQEAYNFLEAIPEGAVLPSAVILDLNMPGWNGIQTMKAIRNNDQYRNIPVFIFTNSNHPEHRELSFAAGATDFITKPYTHQDMIAICKRFADYTQHTPLTK